MVKVKALSVPYPNFFSSYPATIPDMGVNSGQCFRYFEWNLNELLSTIEKSGTNYNIIQNNSIAMCFISS